MPQSPSLLYREKFSSQADPQLLKEFRAMARLEGRHFQILLAEAMRYYLDSKKAQRSRQHILHVFDTSLKTHDELYRKLSYD